MVITPGQVIPATGIHTYNEGEVTQEATCAAEGLRTITCTVCGHSYTEAMPATDALDLEHAAAIEQAEAAYQALSEAEKALLPAETVRKLQEAVARMTVLKAEAADTNSAKNVEQALTKLGDNADPKGADFGTLRARVTSVTAKSLKVSWTKVKGAKGYVIYASPCGKGKHLSPITTVRKNKYTLKKIGGKALQKGRYYKVMVAAYTSDSGYNTIIARSKVMHASTSGGKYTNAKKVTVNASKKTIKKGKKYTIKAKVIKANNRLTLKKHRAISFESSNPKVATVTKKGVVKGKKKGTATIYVYAQNGVYAAVKITVR